MTTELEQQLQNAVNSVPGWTWDDVEVAPLDGGVALPRDARGGRPLEARLPDR